jgi:filamentous hemagglutinin family protein
MAVARKTLRNRMLLTTAAAALMAGLPSAVQAQLVRAADLNSAIDSGGNPGQLTVTDTNATTTDIEVEASVVVAEWSDFNVDLGDTVNVTIDPGLGLTEATLFNRVVGGNPTLINGTINAADINFWLVNQDGIMFGADATVNAQSFFASTVDIANQDIFDFYLGTNAFGNGIDTLNFAGVSTAPITAASGATFITDGSLMFVGQQLNLTGSFDAGTGRAIFVSAADVDVTFTPGSPLSYTVNGGTTVASGLAVDGTVQGAAVEFAMITDVGVVGALLTVDADVTATTAVATDRGVTLLAQSLGAAKPDALVNGAISSTGEVLMNSQGDLTLVGSVGGAEVLLTAAGDLGTGPVTATGGNVTLLAGGNVTTGSVIATEVGMAGGAIDIDSTGGGAVTLGQLGADGAIAIDTSGGLTVNGAINAGGVLTVGGVFTPSSVNFTGNVTAQSMAIDSTGSIGALDLTASNGDIDLIAMTAVTANDVLATRGDVTIQTGGAVTTDSITATRQMGVGGDIDVDSTGGGDLDLGDLTSRRVFLDTTGVLTVGAISANGGNVNIGDVNTPSAVNITGAQTAGSFVINVGSSYVAGDLTATNGEISITAPTITTQDLSATGGDVTLSAPGFISTGSIIAIEAGGMGGAIDVDSTGGGALTLGDLTADGTIALDTTGTLSAGAVDAGGAFTIGVLAMPSLVTLTGNVVAGSLAINTAGALAAQDLTADNGAIALTAGTTITADAVSATDAVTINAPGVVTLASLEADSDLDGAGDLVVGGGTVPIRLNVAGASSGANVDLTVFQIDVGDVSATSGNVDFSSTIVDAGNVSATGGNVTIGSNTTITTTSISATEVLGVGGAIDVDSFGAFALSLGDLTADGAVTLDTNGTLAIGTVNAGGALELGAIRTPSLVTFGGDITAGSFAFTTVNPFSVSNLTTTNGDLTINAPSIQGLVFSATGGDVTLTTPGAVTTTAISAFASGGTGGAIDVDSTGGGTLTLGNLTAGGAIALDTTGALTAGTVNAGGALTIGLAAMPSSVTLTGNAIAQSIDIAAAPTGTVQVLDLTATAGNVTIDPATITTGDVTANGGNVTLAATGAITTGNLTATRVAAVGGAIDVDSTAGGNLVLGDLTADAGITLDTTGSLRAGAVSADDDGDLAGALVVGGTATPNSVRFTGNVAAASVAIDTPGTFVARDLGMPGLATNVTATGGAIAINALSISAGALSATGGNATLNTSGAITTTAIASDMMIDVDSTGGGNLDLGNLTAGAGITLDTTGTLRAGAVNADSDGDLVGALVIGATAIPSSVRFTGNVTAASIDIDTTGALTARDTGAPALVTDLIATNGAVDLNAASISVGNVGASTSATIAATGAVATGDVTAAGGDASLSGASIAAGAVSAAGGNAILTAGGTISSGAITATALGGVGGAIAVKSTAGGNLALGNLNAETGIMLDTTGALTAGAINADSDGDNIGALVIGSMDAPSSVTLNGPVSAAAIAITVDDALNVQDLTTTAGDIALDATSIVAGNLSATGGDVELTADNDITTAALTATATGGVGGAIAVKSMNGDLDLGALSASAGIMLDAPGRIATLAIDADSDANLAGDLLIGSMIVPGSVTIAGDAFGAAIAIASTGLVTAQDLTATNGDVVVDAGALTAQDLTAIPGNVVVRTVGNIATNSATSAGGSIDFDSTGGGAINAGQLAATATITLDTGGNITSGAVTAGGGFLVGSTSAPGAVALGGNVQAGSVDVFASLLNAQDVATTTGDITTAIAGATTTGNLVAANGMVDLQGGGAITTLDVTARAVEVSSSGGAIAAQDVQSIAGAAVLEANGNIATASITATGGGIDVDSTGAGNLALGTLATTNGITLDTGGNIVTGAASAAGALQVGGASLVNDVDFQGAVSAGSVALDATGQVTGLDITATAGNVTVGATNRPDQVTANTVTGSNVVVNSSGFDFADVVASSGNVVITADNVGELVRDTGGIRATGNVTINATGEVLLRQVEADSDLAGGGDIAIGTTIVPSRIRVARGLSAEAITLRSNGGDIRLGSIDAVFDVIARNGDIDILVSGSTNPDTSIGLLTTVTATGGDVLLQTNGGILAEETITANAAGGVGGAIDLQSTGGGRINTAALIADNGILIDTSQSIRTGEIRSDDDLNGTGAFAIGSRIQPSVRVILEDDVIAPSIAISTIQVVEAANLTATAGGIDIAASEIEAGDVIATGAIELDASSRITLTSLIADSDANGTGSVRVGDTTTPSRLVIGTGDFNTIDFTDDDTVEASTFIGGAVSGTSVTLSSTGLVAVGDVTASSGDTAITAGSNLRVDAVDTGALTLSAARTVRIDGVVDAGGTGAIEGRSIMFDQAITVGGAGLTLRSDPDTSILVGDANGDPDAQGGFKLSNAELDLIFTGTLIIDAGANRIDIADVTFANQTGSDAVIIVTRGPGSTIEIEGDITSTGAGRVFQIGENDGGANVTARIIGKIEKSTIDLGTASLDLRANNIVFGSSQLITELNGPLATSADAIAVNFVGAAGSVLFNPDAALVAARGGNNVFLRAGNVTVSYGDTALFQNTIPLADGDIEFAGVEIGAVGSNGSLVLRPTDATNAFALFGVINELTGDAVAFAPEPALVIDGEASVFGSRINGCVIRSGADCITTVVDTATIRIPREVVSLLTADPNVFLPFDPLVGTNNEGLFSGAASGLVDEECQRDENGRCS